MLRVSRCFAPPSNKKILSKAQDFFYFPPLSAAQYNILQSSNLPIFQSSNLQIFKSSNLQIFKSSNPPIFQSSNLQIFKSSNLQIFKSSNPPIFQSSNPPIFKFSNLQINYCFPFAISINSSYETTLSDNFTVDLKYSVNLVSANISYTRADSSLFVNT